MRQYDVVIVGGGIGGLICGCYLSKVGLQVSIVEQQAIMGGCCSSFKRAGYEFDVGVHYLGGIQRGLLGKILEELTLTDKINFFQFDPTDKIILPEKQIYIRNTLENTIKEFVKAFPSEKNNISNFFKFVADKDFISLFSKMRKLNFQDILNAFFPQNPKLKGALCMLLGNIGISSRRISALTAIIFFREFILDPGYYPENGIQSFPDLLMNTFKENGGDVYLAQRVRRIRTENNQVKGVVLENGVELDASIVVSNVDATQTYLQLLDTASREARLVNKLRPSPSLFALYLGLKVDLKKFLSEQCNIWYSNMTNVDHFFSELKRSFSLGDTPFLMISFPSLHKVNQIGMQSSTISAYINAPYEVRTFWEEQRESLTERVLQTIKSFLPFLCNEHIDQMITAIPQTFERYTSNRDGAIFGWAPSPEQSLPSLISQISSVKGLFLAGHWCTTSLGSGGVSGVASLGRNVARLILNQKDIPWDYPILLL